MCGLSMGLLEAGRAGNRRSLGSKRPQPYHFAPCVADSLRTLCCGFTSHLVLRIHKGEREAQNANKVGKSQVLLLARCIGLSDKYKQVTSGPGRSFVQFGPVRKFEQGWAQVPPPRRNGKQAAQPYESYRDGFLLSCDGFVPPTALLAIGFRDNRKR